MATYKQMERRKGRGARPRRHHRRRNQRLICRRHPRPAALPGLRHPRPGGAHDLRRGDLPALARPAADAGRVRSVQRRAGGRDAPAQPGAGDAQADPAEQPSDGGAAHGGQHVGELRSRCGESVAGSELAQGQAADGPGADHHRRPAPHPQRAAGAFAGSQLRAFGQLPLHAARHTAERAGERGDAGVDGAARRSRAERQHLRRARHRQHAQRYALGAGRRPGRAEGLAARRRQPAGDGDDAGHRRRGDRAVLYRRHVGEQEAHHGLRPPRLSHRRPPHTAPAQVFGAVVQGRKARSTTTRSRGASSRQ